MHECGKLWQNFPVCYKNDFQRDMRNRENCDAIESKHNTTTDEWTMMMMTKEEANDDCEERNFVCVHQASRFS